VTWRAERDIVLARIAALEAAQAAQGAAASALADVVATHTGQIATLGARLDALEGGTGSDPHRVLIGASVDSAPTWTTNWNHLETAIGKLQAVRICDPGEATSPVTMFRNVAGKGLEIHSSTKSLSTNVGARQAYYEAVAATGENVVAYTYHEFDDNVSRGEFTFDQWSAAALVDATCCSSLGIGYGICIQLYGVWGWPAIIDRLVADTDLLMTTDVIGLDVYQRGDTEYTQANYRGWSYNGDQISALMARLPSHLRVVLPEFGVPEHPTDAGYRTTYLVEMHAQAVAEKWRAVLPYNAWKPAYPGSKHVSTGPEFLYDTPECRETSRAAMAGFVTLGAANP
jgi:hypothetical protein